MHRPFSSAEIRSFIVPEQNAPWASISDRAWWEARAVTPLGQKLKAAALAEADRIASTPLVPPTLSQALDYERTGDREAWQNRMFEMVHQSGAAVLAAGFDPEPHRIDLAADVLWAVSEVSNWVMPAHRNYETSDSPGFDLAAAMRGQELTESMRVMGGVFADLSPRIAEKFRRDLEERVFQPFVSRDYWYTFPQGETVLNNWTAVCAGGAALAALSALDDEPEWQAEVVSKAIGSLGYFLDTFGKAGSLDEGVGYWSYGFSYYVMAAERIFARTGGKVDLLADPLWKEVAQFPLRANLYGGSYVQFSDCIAQLYPPSGIITFLGQHLNLTVLDSWAREILDREGEIKRFSLPIAVRNLAWQPDEWVTKGAPRQLSVFLPDVQWILARSTTEADALVVAIKGGHNGESHNHNDGGSFVVHFQQEGFIDELGAPTYTRQFFSETRYENIAARSLGHSVPFVNCCEQAVGHLHAAKVLGQDDDGIQLDLTAMYPAEARLVSLSRKLHIDREHRSINVNDEVEFEDEGNTFAVPLILIGRPVIIGQNYAAIQGQKGLLQVHWSPNDVHIRLEDVPSDDPRFVDEEGKSKIRRLWFEVPVSGKRASLQLKLRAEKA